jgi:hypothetical protein
MMRYVVIWMLMFGIFTDLLAQQMEVKPISVIGRDTLRLNAETLKAIKEGTFMNTERLPLKQSVSELPILDDFTEYIKMDTFRKPFPIDSIPPSVLLIYPVDTKEYHIRGIVYKPMKSLVVKYRINLLNKSLYMKVGTGNLFMDEVRDGQRRGTGNVSLGVDFSLEDALRHVFWKSERDKKRNRKREATWKYYNSYP